jgi:hypothetical protein
MPPTHHRYRRHRGVTLVEILMSIFVLSLGIIGASQCMHAALIMNAKATRVAQGTAICLGGSSADLGGIEYWRSIGFGNIQEDIPGTATTGTQTEYPADCPQLPGVKRVTTWTVYTDAVNTRINGKLIWVTVTVSWKGNMNNATESVSMSTMVSNRHRTMGG